MPFEKKFTQQSVLSIAVHPGHIVMEYFDQTDISKLPKILGCSEEQFNNIISLKPDEGLTRLMCLRLAHHFKTSYEFGITCKNNTMKLYCSSKKKVS